MPEQTIHLKYFASVKERLGTSQERITTQAATVGDVRRELWARGGDYAFVFAPDQLVRAALNQTLCEEDAPLIDGAELAFFPPITGG